MGREGVGDRVRFISTAIVVDLPVLRQLSLNFEKLNRQKNSEQLDPRRARGAPPVNQTIDRGAAGHGESVGNAGQNEA